MQSVQVSTGIKDRQIYHTLQKLSKGLSGAVGYTERANGTVQFPDDSGTGTSPKVVYLEIPTGYFPENFDKFSVISGNLFNIRGTTRTGTLGINSNSVVYTEAGEAVILAELITINAWSFTDLTADWVLLELKP